MAKERSNAAVIVIGNARANAERKGHSAKKRLVVRAWQKTGGAKPQLSLSEVRVQMQKERDIAQRKGLQ